ncbi:MAG: hypothetical protein WD535_06310, partial [Thermaerobacterales bacterium]
MNVGEALRSLERQGPAGLYLVTGTEVYLRRGFISRLEKAVLGDDTAFGRHTYQGTDVDLLDLLADLRTIPLFGS